MPAHSEGQINQGTAVTHAAFYSAAVPGIIKAIMDINGRINYRAIIERHKELQQQVQRGYIAIVIGGLVMIFIIGQVYRHVYDENSLIIQVVCLSGFGACLIGAMLAILGSYLVDNLPQIDDEDDDDVDELQFEQETRPRPMSQTSRNQFRIPNTGLTMREWRVLCTAVAANDWRFSRPILEDAGIEGLTSYVDPEHTKFRVVRDELEEAGMVVGNSVPVDKRHLFNSPTPRVYLY